MSIFKKETANTPPPAEILKWKRVRSYTSGDVRTELSSSEGKRGLLYSFCVSKMKKDGTPTKFFHPIDLVDIIVTLEDLEADLEKMGVPTSNAGVRP
jgi:hypothetical protein